MPGAAAEGRRWLPVVPFRHRQPGQSVDRREVLDPAPADMNQYQRRQRNGPQRAQVQPPQPGQVRQRAQVLDGVAGETEFPQSPQPGQPVAAQA